MRRRSDAVLFLGHTALAAGLSLAPVQPAQAQRGGSAGAPPVPISPFQQLGRDVLRELIETNTTVSSIPQMETGSTDGLFLRNAGMPVYGVTGIFYDVRDVRAHGKDERIGVREFYEGLEFQYRLVTAVSSPSA